MTAPAVLWVRTIAPGVTEYVLDCRHASTTAASYTPAAASHPLTEAAIIAIAQHRHERTCRCGRRYLRGVPA